MGSLSILWRLAARSGQSLFLLLSIFSLQVAASEPVCDGKLERHTQDGVEFLSPPGFEGFRIVPNEKCDLSGTCNYDVVLSRSGRLAEVVSNFRIHKICERLVRTDQVKEAIKYEGLGVVEFNSFDSVRIESFTIRSENVWVTAEISTYFNSTTPAVGGLWEGNNSSGGVWSYSTTVFEVYSGMEWDD